MIDASKIGIAVFVAVTDCVCRLVFEPYRDLYDVACDGDFLGRGLEAYGELACAGLNDDLLDMFIERFSETLNLQIT